MGRDKVNSSLLSPPPELASACQPESRGEGAAAVAPGAGRPWKEELTLHPACFTLTRPCRDSIWPHPHCWDGKGHKYLLNVRVPRRGFISTLPSPSHQQGPQLFWHDSIKDKGTGRGLIPTPPPMGNAAGVKQPPPPCPPTTGWGGGLCAGLPSPKGRDSSPCSSLPWDREWGSILCRRGTLSLPPPHRTGRGALCKAA